MRLEEEHANGHEGGGIDPANPDLATMVGVLLRVEGEVSALKQIVGDQGSTIDKIAKALGVEPTRSVPPIRQELASLHEEDERLRKVTADTSGAVAAVSKEVAETKLIVRVSLVEGIPKLVKVGGAIAAGLTVLGTLGYQIWAAIRGH